MHALAIVLSAAAVVYAQSSSTSTSSTSASSSTSSTTTSSVTSPVPTAGLSACSCCTAFSNTSCICSNSVNFRNTNLGCLQATNLGQQVCGAAANSGASASLEFGMGGVFLGAVRLILEDGEEWKENREL
ncbi:hypothetical protein BDQ17DRAFT_1374285 [Cyathus striatus]|nr:hypothetical protein BDQ17DRAFT_1374285 [Cyathus striatus]